MKVLFLSSWFPNRVTPLNGDFVERHAMAVSLRCITSVIYVASDVQIRGRFFEIHEIQKEQLSEIIIYFKRNSSRVKTWATLMNHIYFGIGYFLGYRIYKKRTGKPDIIHANILYPIGIVAWLLSIFTRTPYIISEHWTFFLSNSIKIPSRGLLKKVVGRAFAICTVTHDLALALQRHGFAGNYYFVPNVVNTHQFRISTVARVLPKKRLLHVSSMKEEQKNISGLIKTLKQLQNTRNDFNFTFIGEYQDHQRKLVYDLGISDNIVFMGELSHAEVAMNMQQSELLVLFSRVENLPCVILEAWACGIPVVSTNVGGIHEWVNESNGILISSGDEEALFNALNYILDHLDRYDKNILRQYAVDHFSQQAISEQFYTIYEKAVKNNG